MTTAMRALLVVMVFAWLGDPASAGGRRDCTTFADKTVTATDLGCFETLRWKDDYVYGTRGRIPEGATRAFHARSRPIYFFRRSVVGGAAR